MSESPPAPLELQTPPVRSHRLSYVISWTVILLCVGLVVVGVNTRSSETESARTPKTDPALKVLSHIAVATKSFSPADASQSTRSHDAIAELDASAKSTDEKIRAAIVAGELAGSETVLKRLELLRTSPEPIVELDSLRTIYTQGADALPASDKQQLRDRFGWYARLALVYGLPDSDPNRAAVLGEAKRFFLGVMAFGGSLLVLGVAGLILLVLAIVLRANPVLRSRFVPVVPVTGRGDAPPVFLEAFALYLVLVVLFGTALELLFDDVPMIWQTAVTVILPLVMLWPVWRGATWDETKAGFGWRFRGQNLLVEPLMGFVGYIAGIPLLVLAFFVTMQLMKLSGITATHPIVEEYGAGGWRVAQLYLIAAVWAPLMEETMFRGALFNHLRGRRGWVLSALITGVIFAAIHPQGWTFLPVLATLGFVFAGIREWRGSIWASMAAHALNNAVIVSFGVMLFGGN